MKRIIEIPPENRWNYRELLLLADPEEQAVSRYLMDGEMYVLQVDGRDVTEAVVKTNADGECELMNLATVEQAQGRGHAGELVRWLMARYARQANTMLVGTSEDGRAFYERLGFKEAFVRKRFFIEQYREPIIENGRRCVDMYCLRVDLPKQEKHYQYVQNRACEFFPCHAGADEDNFNCLFCYCPLYALGRKCGGLCSYTESGDKDCSACLFPHQRENYERVLARYGDIRELVRRNDER